MSLLIKKQLDKQYHTLKSLPESVNKFILSQSIKRYKIKEAPRRTCLSAVFTLEAAVIAPLFAAFFVSILFFFCVMQVQLEVQNATSKTSRTLAALAETEQKSGDDLLGVAAIKLTLMKELAGKDMINRYVTGKAAGIIVLGSNTQNDYIEIKTEYHMKLPISLLGKRDIRLASYSRSRKWTGWHEGDVSGDEDVWVYITETGTVYHRSRECSHIKLSVQTISETQLEGLRNENGEKYHECLLCAEKKNNNGLRYITKQGDKYHYDLNCSGIKRTVKMIRLSEVGERPACSKCGVTRSLADQ